MLALKTHSVSVGEAVFFFFLLYSLVALLPTWGKKGKNHLILLIYFKVI